MQTAVAALASRGHSIRHIARQLGINRRTVRRYLPAVALGEASAGAKCTTPQPQVTTGSGGSGELPASAKCTTPPSQVTTGSRSRCHGLREVIVPLMEAGLSAERIWQDLRAGHDFEGSYSSVRRFVAALRTSLPRRIWRVECEPGEELQIDFMAGPLLPDPARLGKHRRCWILRAVLSHSRKGYSEAVWRQDSESFLRALENALRSFSGVPQTLNLDNLKAAVKKADWFDPELSPKFADFCRHYGITPMPCRPYSPEHKGKVERSVRYVRHNALAGREFESLLGLNAHLRQWEASVADTRIHGTTRRQIGEHFASIERPALQALPVELYPAFTEATRRVGRDSYVEVAKAYYQVPPEHIGRSVWVRYDGRQVRIFNARMEQIASHTRLEPGRYSQVRGMRGLDHAGTLQNTLRHWHGRAQAIGPAAAQWAQRAVEQRGAEAVRSLMGLCALRNKHPASHLNAACARAQCAHSSNPTLRQIRQQLADRQGGPQQSLMPFAQGHPIIRPLSHYAEFVHTQTHTQPHPNHHEPHHHLEDPGPQTAA